VEGPSQKDLQPASAGFALGFSRKLARREYRSHQLKLVADDDKPAEAGS
jgi:hypothetical protein